ncbi:ARF GTPase activating protein [Cryptosporidium ryanae]|uniref:ARF GTPase activating protein n=1 Tax=Cryptosporidium ryanae TaxID=515981 RepID=UPI00351AAEF7|nr:ARF GTPase activating protein [Cryptosporidium ryanae]
MRNYTEIGNSLTEIILSFQKSCNFNRKCANCNDIGPNYICLDFGTFICSTCSGIHREFNHKIKSISLSNWTLNEVKNICKNGNKKDAEKYLCNIESFPFSSQVYSKDYNKLKTFIKNKYIDCLWINKSKYEINNIHDNEESYINKFQSYDKSNNDNHNYNRKKNVDRNPFSILL